jgi:hypothetical protein
VCIIYIDDRVSHRPAFLVKFSGSLGWTGQVCHVRRSCTVCSKVHSESIGQHCVKCEFMLDGCGKLAPKPTAPSPSSSLSTSTLSRHKVPCSSAFYTIYGVHGMTADPSVDERRVCGSEHYALKHVCRPCFARARARDPMRPPSPN